MADVTQASSQNRRGARSQTSAGDDASASSGTLDGEAKGPEALDGHDLRDDLLAYAELFFFAYRDFISEPDEILETYGFGRAHHRVLHFVHRSPGLRVAQLLNILKITKQSLARVLKQLIGEGFVTQRAGEVDGRERLLYVTPKGAELAETLAALQVARIKSALESAGPGTDAATRRFLFAMISKDEQQHVASLLESARDAASSNNESTDQ